MTKISKDALSNIVYELSNIPRTASYKLVSGETEITFTDCIFTSEDVKNWIEPMSFTFSTTIPEHAAPTPPIFTSQSESESDPNRPEIKAKSVYRIDDPFRLSFFRYRIGWSDWSDIKTQLNVTKKEDIKFE